MFLAVVAFRGGVGTDEDGDELQGVEIRLIVTGRFAGTVGGLVNQRKAQDSLGGNHGRGLGENKRNKS